MTLLPVVERELRVAARRPATHWSRGIAALVGFGILAAILVTQNGRMREAALAQAVFNTLAFAAFGAAGLSGVFLTADCLSEEKREGTLGLLFLTDLRGWDVVLGKLVSTSVLGVYGLLAILPMLALPVMFGGVGFGEFAATSAALVSIMLLSLAIGVVVSAFCRHARTVTAATLGIVLVLGGGLVLPIQLIEYLAPQAGLVKGLKFFSSIHLMIAAISPGMGGGSGSSQLYQFCLLTHLGLVAVALAIASRVLPRRWQEGERTVGVPRPSRVPLAAWVPVGFGETRAAERDILASNPFRWLAWRLSGSDQLAKTVVRALLAVFVPLWLVGTFAKSNTAGPYLIACMMLAYGIHAITKVQMAMSAVRRLSEDRSSGALELILVTPLPLRRILEGQFAAYTACWRHTMLGIAVPNFLLLITILCGESFNGREVGIFVGFMAAGAVLTWIDYRAIGWVGIHMALSHPKPHRAALATAVRVMLPGMVGIFLGVLTLMAVGGGDSTVTFLHWTWVMICLGIGMFLQTRGRIGARQELEAIRVGRNPDRVVPARRSARDEFAAAANPGATPVRP